mmetsp:Transcript_83/g.220  ORF Transcript_83/g.220 Transcript_83/m.220 type:complete len:241 (+) Transcript_83:509-1231(+)
MAALPGAAARAARAVRAGPARARRCARRGAARRADRRALHRVLADDRRGARAATQAAASRRLQLPATRAARGARARGARRGHVALLPRAVDALRPREAQAASLDCCDRGGRCGGHSLLNAKTSLPVLANSIRPARTCPCCSVRRGGGELHRSSGARQRAQLSKRPGRSRHGGPLGRAGALGGNALTKATDALAWRNRKCTGWRRAGVEWAMGDCFVVVGSAGAPRPAGTCRPVSPDAERR